MFDGIARDEIITVIAGGPSAKGLDFDRLPGRKIGVNKAGLLSCVDMIITMDRLWAEDAWLELKLLQKPTWFRRSCLKNIPDRPTWLTIFECDHTSARPVFDPEYKRLNGTNSGMCGINLALALRPKAIVLIGFDMRRVDGNVYWHSPHKGQKEKGNTSDVKYSMWSKQFAHIAVAARNLKIRVVNASLVSAIPDFPKVDPKMVLV